MLGVASRYALRSVQRNSHRTLLSVVGIAIGCVLALSMESLNRGRDELFARAGAYVGAGHVRIVPAGWRDRRDVRLRLADGQADLQAARALAGVTAATPRARAQALLAMGTHVTAVEMVGVDPEREPETNRFVRTLHEGRYLGAHEAGAIVIGGTIADRLSAGLDDDLLATVVGAGGDIESAMFRIVGIARTGSDDLDDTICHVTLGDLAKFTGLAGAGEVAIVLADYRRTDDVRARLAPAVARGDDVMTWGELNPEFKGHMEQDQATNRVVSWIILLIVLLGVASAQLAAVLERRREFAVLSALGMSTGTLVRLVLQEAVTIGVAGGLAGLAIGTPLIWRFAHKGLDLRGYVGVNYTFGGTIIEPIIFGDFGAWMVPYVLAVAIGATVLASLYPARFAARTDPAVALRVAQ